VPVGTDITLSGGEHDAPLPTLDSTRFSRGRRSEGRPVSPDDQLLVWRLRYGLAAENADPYAEGRQLPGQG
jgi:hypothetical protein